MWLLLVFYLLLVNNLILDMTIIEMILEIEDLQLVI